jgi:hypothetical protein
MFLPWALIVRTVGKNNSMGLDGKYSSYARWLKRKLDCNSVKKTLATVEKLAAQQ